MTDLDPEDVRKEVFDDVMDTEEQPHPHRHEHAKADPRPDDEELERRTELERSEVGLPEEPGEGESPVG